VGLTVALTVCLYACVRALGGDVGWAAAAGVLLIGSALGSAVPTPGGIGGVEGAMVGAFLAVGLPVAVALPAVLAFRLVSFWLPVPAGLAALAWLRRRRHL
jgi:glycosyltransferase 2 family protein